LALFAHPKRDLVAAAIEAHSRGIQGVEWQASAAGGVCIQLSLPHLAPVETRSLVAYLEANPQPSYVKSEVNRLFGIVFVSMSQRVHQAFPAQQLDGKADVSEIVLDEKIAKTDAERLHLVDARRDPLAEDRCK